MSKEKEAKKDNVAVMLENIEPRLLDIAKPSEAVGGQVLLVPNGMNAESVQKYLDERLSLPKRRKGIISAQRLGSFIDLANRFKNDASVNFAKSEVKDNSISASVTAILNYHPAVGDNTKAEHGDHRVLYQFPLSKELKFWLSNNTTAMTQTDFALLLEERINEMVVASEADRSAIHNLSPKFAEPLEILELSKSLTIYSEDATAQSVNLATGEKEIKFKSEHRDSSGKPVKVPDFFVIKIPLFEGEAYHRVLVRLRYRKNDGVIIWFYDLYRLDLVFQDAFDAALKDVTEKTKLPLFIGSAE